MDADPVFPDKIGDETFFTKDGLEYRLLRYDEDTWLIHKRGASREQFELVLTPDGKLWDVEGRGHFGPLMAPGVTLGFMLTKLF